MDVVCPECTDDYSAFELEMSPCPMPGNPSCCPSCGVKLVYAEDLTLRPMTAAEYKKLSKIVKERFQRLSEDTALYKFIYGKDE